MNAGRLEEDEEMKNVQIVGATSSPEKQASAKKKLDDTLKTIREEENEDTLKVVLEAGKKEGDVVDRDDCSFSDSDEDISKAEEPVENVFAKKDFTFMGDEGVMKNDILSKFTNVEQIREYLEDRLGEETMIMAYPLLQEFVS
jgi:hypothetical protein